MAIEQRPKVGVALFIWKDGKFLIGKRKGKHGNETWSIPGGHLEFGENWEQAATRELMEETGLSGKNYQFVAATNDIFDTGEHYISIWMACDWSSGSVKITSQIFLMILSGAALNLYLIHYLSHAGKI